MLLCLATPAAPAAEQLGRLFLTPQIKEGPLTLDGHVQRSGGKTTTWINGVPQYDSHASRDPARLTVVPNEGEPGVSLKIGQIYERTSGEVRDRLNGGEITVRKSAPKVQAAAKRGAAAKSSTPGR